MTTTLLLIANKKANSALLTDFEKRLLNLCDGSNTIGKYSLFWEQQKICKECPWYIIDE